MDIYQDLFERGPIPIAVFDIQGQCLLANRAFYNQLGYPSQALRSAAVQFEDLFESREEASALIRELRERQVLRRREIRMKDADDQIITMLFSGRTLEWNGRQSFDVVLTDITQQKRLEKASRSDHARMASLIEGLTAGLFLVDNEGVIIEFNLALANLLGLAPGSMMTKPYRELFHHFLLGAIEPEVVQQSLAHAVRAVAERPVVEIARGGETIQYLEIALFPVWDGDGLPLGWGGLVQDVTEIRDRLTWKLELLSILAHDIRTPLATLKGHATALLANYRQWGDEMVGDFLEAMNRTTDDLTRQVDRSLALTRVEAGRLGLRPVEIDLRTIIQQSIERTAGVLEETPIELNCPQDLPKVRADPSRLEEVIINLLDNAARFNPPGDALKISVSVQGSYLQIGVADSGPGIPQERQRQIFEKYAGDTDQASTGLGLYIARKIVQAHGGQIWVDSPTQETDGGATFKFTLPLMPQQPRTSPKPSPSPHEIQKPKAGEVRVLVVEDEADAQALYNAILSEEGYEIAIAADGPTALDICRISPPDIVLLDWMLPGMDGLAVCRTMRRWSNIPILLITSRTSQADLITGLDAGADDYVTKPFQPTELLARMRALLRRHSPTSAEERNWINMGGLLIDFDAHHVWVYGERIDLTPTEFELLALMAQHQGQVLTYDQLVDHLWGLEAGRSRHDLFVHVSRLRKKIEIGTEEPRFIVTRWGVGYVFLPEIRS